MPHSAAEKTPPQGVTQRSRYGRSWLERLPSSLNSLLPTIDRSDIASKPQARWIFHYKKPGNTYFLKAKNLQVRVIRSLQALGQVMVLTATICRSPYPNIILHVSVEISLWSNATMPWMTLVKELSHIAATKAVQFEGTSLEDDFSPLHLSELLPHNGNTGVLMQWSLYNMTKTLTYVIQNCWIHQGTHFFSALSLLK